MVKIARAMGLMALSVTLLSCASHPRRGELRMPYDDRLRLASIYIQSGQSERAEGLLRDALAQEEGRPEAHAMLGEVLFLKGDLEGSSRHLYRALQVGGDDAVVLNNLAWVELGRSKAGKALELTDRAISLQPVPLYPYLDTRSRALLELNRYEEALVEARAALNLTPQHDTSMRGHLRQLIGEIEGRMRGIEGGFY
ncbi:MAG: tetratricopeptide repeat protein [bacterium]|nr:MAG: tetratricopeptide repeat protein [bacterium]